MQTSEQIAARCSAAFDDMMAVANDHDLSIKELAEVGLNLMCWSLESSDNPPPADLVMRAVDECRAIVRESLNPSNPVQ
jgi:hypothetical protein